MRMKETKQYYRNKAYNGYEWGGWLGDEKLHFFQRGNYSDGFTVVKCKEEELTDKSTVSGKSSFQLMCDTGHTR